MPQLRILDLPGRGVFDLDLSAGGIIGREAGVALQIEHPTVSRQHAQIVRSGAQVVVVDMGSANGTRINGIKITGPTTLHEGDSIEFGKVSTLFFNKNAPTMMAPSAAKPLSATEPSTADAGTPSVAPLGAAPGAMPNANIARIPLEKMEDLLAGLLEILSQPRALTERAQHVSQIFNSMLPSLSQAALLDPCGKLLGGITNGRLLPEDFYGAVSGALGAYADGGAMLLDGPALKGLCAQLKLKADLPESVVCIPLESAVFPNGALYLESNIAFFSGEVADVLRVGARVLGPLLDRAPLDARLTLSNDDIKLAQKIQHKLLRPAPPSSDGLRIAVQYVPHYVIGGDFYDFAILPKKEYAFILGDVSGKGASASLVMAQIMALSREFLPLCSGPAAFLTRINASLADTLEPGVFATLAVVYLNADKGACRIALAGHNPPVIRTKAGKVLELGFDPGAPLGALNKLETKEQRVLLTVGDALILNSDGLDECERLDKGAKHRKLELFGTERRDEVIARSPGAQNLVIALREAVFSFSGEERSSDDLTILVIERV
jgi:phosphoserine phosphatase RsbU/P